MSPSEFPHALEHFSDASFSYSLVFLGHSDTLVTVSVQTWLVMGFQMKKINKNEIINHDSCCPYYWYMYMQLATT